MKTNLFFLTLFFHFTVITAQQIDSVSSCLFVTKDDKLLQFKDNRYLHVRTTDGQYYRGKKYLFQDESIIFSSGPNFIHDTIQLKDIIWIKGRTYGSEGRIFGGSMLIVASPTLGFYPVLSMAFGVGGGPALLVAIPFVAMFGEGVALLFPRKFNIAGKWKLEVMIR